jgi:tRNA threonylcarbamoyladenosine biosynthesis protein TsaB
MLTLGLDTAGTVLAVALAQDGKVLGCLTSTERRGQGEILPVFIEELLGVAKAGYKDITAVAVATGPGSFTGLRMGIAGAQGIARASGCKLFGLDRFELVRRGCGFSGPLAVVLDSLRDEIFVQFGEEEPGLLPVPALRERVLAENWAVCGDGLAALGALPSSVVVLDGGDTATTLALEAQRRLKDKTAALPPALPFYLRPPDITLPRPLSG